MPRTEELQSLLNLLLCPSLASSLLFSVIFLTLLFSSFSLCHSLFFLVSSSNFVHSECLLMEKDLKQDKYWFLGKSFLFIQQILFFSNNYVLSTPFGINMIFSKLQSFKGIIEATVFQVKFCYWGKRQTKKSIIHTSH